MKLKANLKSIAATLALSLAVSVASAANFSFSGTFNHDNDVQRFSFTVGALSSVSLRSWSYAGGTNAAGNAIARGGFDPILALFDATGALLNEQDDAGCPAVDADSVTGSCYDTFFTTNLAAGSYIATVQQFDNFAVGPNLSDGFVHDGVANQNFAGGFVDANNDQRDSHWAFDILNVNSASETGSDVPEPESLALVALGLIGLAASRRRKQQ